MAKKRYLALALAATMTVGLFAGCGSSDSGSSGGSGETAKESSESGDSGEKSKLTFWFPTFAASDGEVTDEEFWNEKMDKFEEENNCEVKVEIIP